MDGFVFTVLLFLLFLSLMVFVIWSVKGKRLSVYLAASTATVSARFAGLVLDVNIDFGEPGFLSFRTLLPVLAMGLCILKELARDKTDK